MSEMAMDTLVRVGFLVVLIPAALVGLAVVYPSLVKSKARADLLANPPPLDPDRGDPLLAELRAACRRGDLGAVVERLEALAGTDWDLRAYYYRELRDDLPRAPIEAWAASSPENPTARLLKGIAYLAYGWQARGAGVASTVTGEGWRLLKERLQVAQAELEEAARLAPNDPLPWDTMIMVCLGLGLGEEEVARHFREAVARDPASVSAHRWRCESLKKKWSRNPHAALEFARDVSRRAPDGSDLHMVVLDALIEEWIWFEPKEQKSAFLFSSEVREEAWAAMRRSVLHPAHVDRHGWSVWSVNLGAFFAFVQNDEATVDRLVERLGAAAGAMGWYCAPSDVPRHILEARRRLGSIVV